MFKDPKKVCIYFIQIKWKNKEELGSDKKERIESLFSNFELSFRYWWKTFKLEKMKLKTCRNTESI